MSPTRRKFLNYVIGGGLAGWIGSVIYPIFAYLQPPKIPEADVNSIKAGVASEFLINTGNIV